MASSSSQSIPTESIPTLDLNSNDENSYKNFIDEILQKFSKIDEASDTRRTATANELFRGQTVVFAVRLIHGKVEFDIMIRKIDLYFIGYKGQSEKWRLLAHNDITKTKVAEYVKKVSSFGILGAKTFQESKRKETFKKLFENMWYGIWFSTWEVKQVSLGTRYDDLFSKYKTKFSDSVAEEVKKEVSQTIDYMKKQIKDVESTKKELESKKTTLESFVKLSDDEVAQKVEMEVIPMSDRIKKQIKDAKKEVDKYEKGKIRLQDLIIKLETLGAPDDYEVVKKLVEEELNPMSDNIKMKIEDAEKIVDKYEKLVAQKVKKEVIPMSDKKKKKEIEDATKEVKKYEEEQITLEDLKSETFRLEDLLGTSDDHQVAQKVKKELNPMSDKIKERIEHLIKEVEELEKQTIKQELKSEISNLGSKIKNLDDKINMMMNTTVADVLKEELESLINMLKSFGNLSDDNINKKRIEDSIKKVEELEKQTMKEALESEISRVESIFKNLDTKINMMMNTTTVADIPKEGESSNVVKKGPGKEKSNEQEAQRRNLVKDAKTEVRNDVKIKLVKEELKKLKLNRKALRNAVSYLKDEELNEKESAKHIIILIQMICEAVRIKLISEHINNNYLKKTKDTEGLTDDMINWQFKWTKGSQMITSKGRRHKGSLLPGNVNELSEVQKIFSCIRGILPRGDQEGDLPRDDEAGYEE